MKLFIENIKGRLLVKKVEPKSKSKIILNVQHENIMFGKVIQQGKLDYKVYEPYVIFQYGTEIVDNENNKYFIVDEKNILCGAAFEPSEIE